MSTSISNNQLLFVLPRLSYIDTSLEEQNTRVDVPPNTTVTLETLPRAEGPVVDLQTEWQVGLSLAPPKPMSIAFRTDGVRGGSRGFGVIERVAVSP